MEKSTHKKNFDPEHMSPQEQLKFEIAEELGLKDRVLAGGWKCLTSKESGRIGGLIARKKREWKRLEEQEEQVKKEEH